MRMETTNGHSLEHRRKIQASVKKTLARKRAEEAKKMRQIDGVKLPCIRVGVRKPEPVKRKVKSKPGTTHNAKPVQLPNGDCYPSIAKAADALGTNPTDVSRAIAADNLCGLLDRLQKW